MVHPEVVKAFGIPHTSTSKESPPFKAGGDVNHCDDDDKAMTEMEDRVRETILRIGPKASLKR